MKQLKDVLGGILVPSLCGAMLPGTAQVPTNENQEMHHAHSVKNYVIVMSWEHQRELYIADGMSEAKADSII